MRSRLETVRKSGISKNVPFCYVFHRPVWRMFSCRYYDQNVILRITLNRKLLELTKRSMRFLFSASYRMYYPISRLPSVCFRSSSPSFSCIQDPLVLLVLFLFSRGHRGPITPFPLRFRTGDDTIVWHWSWDSVIIGRHASKINLLETRGTERKQSDQDAILNACLNSQYWLTCSESGW
jgi:hypothetical protein